MRMVGGEGQRVREVGCTLLACGVARPPPWRAQHHCRVPQPEVPMLASFYVGKAHQDNIHKKLIIEITIMRSGLLVPFA